MKKYYRVKEERNILYEIKRRKANWIGHIFRRTSLIKTRCERKERGKDSSDEKTRKKT
jgi:hypothetical protein